MVASRPFISAVSLGLSLLLLSGCATDPRKSKDYNALVQSRKDVIAAAVQVRSNSKTVAHLSEDFSGSYGPCLDSGLIHYILETDWITPENDDDDLNKFNHVVKILLNAGWKDASTPTRRERKMRRGELAIGVVIRPGADWIEGKIGGPCYKVGNVATDFINRGIDHLS
jgi:hypothetical protein